MRLLLLLFLIFFASLIKAQDSLNTKKIDSLVRVVSQKAANKGHKVIEGTLLKEDNKTSSIRFHLEGNTIEMIVVESDLKEDVTLYYFNDRKLIYVANFTNGNYNEIDSSFYLGDNTAYKKKGSILEKANSEFLKTQVSSYFDLFKEQLKGK